MEFLKNAKDKESHGGVRPTALPPKPKPPEDEPAVYDWAADLAGKNKEHRTSVEILFINGITRTFVGATAIKYEKEIVIAGQGTIIAVPLKNILYWKTSTVKEENNGISIQR